MSGKFAVYQIDFSAQAAGKRVASTKRKIRWRFGFPNKEALDAGKTGPECRGEEHDVTVVWSITSGKRQIMMDTREVHYSSSRAGILDCSWTTKGNHVVKVVCHAAPPLSPTPGFRQYDLHVDGQSFFLMPRMYELGMKGGASTGRAIGGYSNPTSPISMDSGYPRSVGAHPSSTTQEDEDLRRAIQESLEESRRHLERSSGAPAPTGAQSVGGAQAAEGDLLDFGSPTPSRPPAPPGSDARSVSGMSYYSAPPAYSQTPAYASPPPYQSPPPSQAPVPPGALVPLHGPPGGYYQGPPPTTPGYGSPPPVPPAPAPTPANYGAPPPQANYMNPLMQQSNDVFALQNSAEEDPFAPKLPPPQDFASMILGAYQSPAPPSTPGPNDGTNQQQYQQNGYGSPYTPQSNGGTPSQGLSMNALVSTQEEEKPISDLERAMKNLVNFDRIDEPAEGEYKLTMMKKEESKKKHPKGKSVPLPPVGSTVVGSGASLSQIKQVQHGQRTLKQSADGVMNAPPPGAFSAGAAAAGALVVHGQGPPPLHQPQGFGLGARLPNGGFSQQQQVPMGYQHQYR